MAALKRALPLFLTAAAAAISGRAQSAESLPSHMASEAVEFINSFADTSWKPDTVDSKSCTLTKTNIKTKTALAVQVTLDSKGPKDQPLKFIFNAYNEHILKLDNDIPVREGYTGNITGDGGQIQHYSLIIGTREPISLRRYPLPPDVRKALLAQDPIGNCAKAQSDKNPQP